MFKSDVLAQLKHQLTNSSQTVQRHRNINIAYSHSQCKYYKQSYAQVVCCLQTTNVDLSSSITRLVLIHMLLQFAYPILIWQTFIVQMQFLLSYDVLNCLTCVFLQSLSSHIVNKSKTNGCQKAIVRENIVHSYAL